jgi:hypothetical protein
MQIYKGSKKETEAILNNLKEQKEEIKRRYQEELAEIEALEKAYKKYKNQL